MNQKNKYIISFIWGIISFIVFILQSILTSNGQYKSKDFKEIIENWKKIPILDISIYSDEKYFKEKDSITIGSTHLYLRKMDKKYNYAKLLLRSKNLVSKQICGKDTNGNDIYFPAYETCPINYMKIDYSCDSSIYNCIDISSGIYLVYSNKFIQNEIVVNISNYDSYEINYNGYIGINYYDINDISDKMENLLSISSKFKKKNITALVFILTFIPFLIFILSIFCCENKIEYAPDFLKFAPLTLYLHFCLALIICYSFGIHWSNETKSILKSIGFETYIMDKKYYNIELTCLIFICIMCAIYIFRCNNKDSEIDDFEEICGFILVAIIIFGIISGILILPIIFLHFNIQNNIFDNGLYKDLVLNYKMSPITKIDISEYSTISDNKDSSYFNSKVPYILAKNVKKNGDIYEIEYLTKWKNKIFYVTRMNKKITYPYLLSYYDKNDRKICGKDSVGNYIYFPENEHCPINYIEFTSNEYPSLPNYEEYKWTTKSIDSNTYMHYTNDYIEGQILVHIRMSTFKPMSDTNSYNDICYLQYGINNCKIDNNYHGYDDKYGYQEVDYDSFTQLYLYTRTYSGINQYLDNNKVGNFMFKIEKYIQSTHIVSLIFYVLILLILIISFIIHFRDSVTFENFLFPLTFIGFIMSIIMIIMNSKILREFNKIKNKIILNSEFDIKSDFITQPLLIKFDIGILVYSSILCLVTFILSLFYLYERKSCFTYKVQNQIEKFLFRTQYIPEIIFLLFLLLLALIIFPTLLLFNGLYKEGYIDSITENWKKIPIMDIELSNDAKEQIGYFKNFPDEKYKKLYKWKGNFFSFKRKSGKYYYNKILSNKEYSNKKCGVDNQGNELYFREDDICPINYVTISNTEPILDGVIHYKSIAINDEQKLFYTNEYTKGRILIDFRISDIKGPCLNKKKNNEICSFYLEKCNLKEKDFICDAYKTDNGFNILDTETFNQLIYDNDINTNYYYDSSNTIYLYSETYIGYSSSGKELETAEKQSGNIYSIKNYSNGKNIFLFLSMFIYIMGGICFFIFKRKKDAVYNQNNDEDNIDNQNKTNKSNNLDNNINNNKNKNNNTNDLKLKENNNNENNNKGTNDNENNNKENNNNGNDNIENYNNEDKKKREKNEALFKERIKYMTFLSFICIIISIFALICLILSAISLGKYVLITNNILKQFENELSDYYSKFQWQEIIEIFNLFLYLIGFVVYSYFSLHYLKQSEYNLFKLFKFDVTIIKNGFKKIRRPQSRFLIVNFVILTSFSLIISIILLYIKDYDDGYSLDVIKNWKLSPIESLEISSTYTEYKLGTFKGISDSTYGESKEKPFYKFNGYSFKVKRLDSKYNYPYFFKNKDSNSKKCGIDNEGNGIYFPKEQSCPINYISISKSSECPISKEYSCKNIQFNDYYLHYSNDYILGKILIDFAISTNESSPCGNLNYDNDICRFFNVDCSNIHQKICSDTKTNYGYEKIDISTLELLFKDNEIEVGDSIYEENKPVYLYYRTYKGIERINAQNIKKTKNYLPIYMNISNFSKGKNIYFVIIHFIIVILFIFIFYFFDEEEMKYEPFLYGIALFEIIINIINIILCSITLSYHNILKNNIFKILNSDVYEYYNKIQDSDSLSILLIILNILLIATVIFWIYYYYTHRDIYFPTKSKIIEKLEQPDNQILYSTLLITFIILILICILIGKKEYNGGYFKGLEKNWNKSPIYSIETSSSENYELGYFPGTKNEGYGMKNGKKIYFWNSKSFLIERKKGKYSNYLKKKNNYKLCGKDSRNNDMYFPDNENCPINYIKITSDSNPPISTLNFKKLQLGNKYLYYTNEYTSGKILVDFKISDTTPSISLNKNNNVCKYIDDMCNLDSGELIYDLNTNDENIFDLIDSISLQTLFKENNLNINTLSYDSSKIISLFAQTYIGVPDSDTSTSHILEVYNFSKNKNIIFLIFTLFFFIFTFINFEFVKIILGLIGFIIFVLVNVCVLINFILSIVSISFYYNMNNNTFQKFNNSISTDFKNTKWYCKTNFALVFLFVIDFGLGIANYYFLKEKGIISFRYQLEIYKNDFDQIITDNATNITDLNKENDIDKLKNLKENLEKTITQLNDDIDECKFEFLAEKLETIKSLFKLKNDEYEEIKNFKLEYEKNKEKESKKIDNLQNEMQNLEKVKYNNQDIITTKIEYDEKIDKKNKEIEEIINKNKDLQKKIKAKEEEIRNLNQQIEEKTKEYQKSKNTKN